MEDYSDIPQNRAEAKQVGSKYYFTGNPCPKGHNGLRYTSKGSCADCAKESTAKAISTGYYKKRYQQKKEQILANQKKRYHADPELRKRIAATQKRWNKKNIEKLRLYKRLNKHTRRTVKRRGASAAKVRKWLNQQSKVCYWCDIPCETDYTIDHYVALTKGGPHEIENLVIACRSCNVRKQARDPLEFAASLNN